MATKFPSPFPSLDPKDQLTITDLAEVLQLLRRHGYSGVGYYDLGLYLGLSHNTLDVIEADHKGDTGRCLSEYLTKWLLKADDVRWTKGGPSIYSLISALRGIGENRVADGIDREKHPACRILDCYASFQSLLSAALPQLGIYLYKAGLIQKMIIPRYIRVQGESLMDEIKAAVCKDYRKLEEFADILCKSTAADDIRVGYSIKRDYREVYRSDDKNVEKLVIYLPNSIHSEIFLMRSKFGQTFIKVESIMKRNPQSPSLDDIKLVLSRYNRALSPQLAQCKDISDILQLVHENSSLDDISMLEFIVNGVNIEGAKPVIKEYKGAVEKLKMKLRQFMEEVLLKASSLPESVTIIIDEDTDDLVLNGVQRLSSAVLSRYIKVEVIRADHYDGGDYGGIWKDWEQDESSTDTNVVPTVQSKDTCTLTSEVPGGTTGKDEDTVMLLQEKVESIQKELEEEKELHEKEKKFHEQVIKKYEEELLQQKRELISDNELTHKQLEELQKKLKEESLTSSSFMKQKETLQIKIDDLQQELQQFKDHKEVSVQCEYTISQSEQAPVHQKEESEILQETETVHTCTYISKGDISQLSVILEPVEDDWYHIGQCFEVKESVLTEIKEMTPVDSRLTHVLETWCHEKDRTITELKDSLKRMDRDDILEGLHELPTGQYTMNNDEEYDINVKDSNDEVETQIETENKEIQTTQTTLDKEIQFNYLVPSQDNLEGLSESQIAGKKLFLVQGDKPQLMNWEEYGLRISVPEDSLSASETVEVSVLALVGGHFKFPDNTRLVSAVYAISTSPLLKSLRIEMQHCIDLSDPSLSKYLKFAVAPVHIVSLPYQFSLIEGGEFPAYQRYGSIERSKFCQLAIVGEEEEENGGGRNEERNGQEDGDSGDEGKGQREGQGAGRQEGGAGGVGRSDREEEGNGLKEPVDCTEDSELSTSQSTTIVSTHSTGIPEATVYAGQVFYQREERRDLMTFTAARDLNPLRQYIKKEYSHPEIDQSIYFKLASSPKGSCIELIFNAEQPEEITGWRIKPHLVPCQIKEHEILGFGDISTTIPPSCLVSIYAENSPHTVPNLSYSVPLKGVQEQVELIINRPLRNMSSLHSVPSLPVSAVPVVVTDESNLGVCALNALKKQQDKLKSLLSRSEPIFRDIAVACKSATIIHSTEYDKIFDVKTGQSLAERADTFINSIMSVVDVCPDQLEVFLNIVMNKGNIAFVRIAELISQCWRKRLKRNADQSQTDDDELCPPTTKKNNLHVS